MKRKDFLKFIAYRKKAIGCAVLGFSLLLAGVFREIPPPRRTVPRLSVGFLPLLLPRIAFYCMQI